MPLILIVHGSIQTAIFIVTAYKVVDTKAESFVP
jgi:hypothetical protein